jgi:hypothetical protein
MERVKSSSVRPSSRWWRGTVGTYFEISSAAPIFFLSFASSEAAGEARAIRHGRDQQRKTTLFSSSSSSSDLLSPLHHHRHHHHHHPHANIKPPHHPLHASWDNTYDDHTVRANVVGHRVPDDSPISSSQSPRRIRPSLSAIPAPRVVFDIITPPLVPLVMPPRRP